RPHCPGLQGSRARALYVCLVEAAPGEQHVREHDQAVELGQRDDPVTVEMERGVEETGPDVQLTPSTPARIISNSASGAHRPVAKDSARCLRPPHVTEFISVTRMPSPCWWEKAMSLPNVLARPLL